MSLFINKQYAVLDNNLRDRSQIMSAANLYTYIYILTKTQVFVFVYLYTVFHVALKWTTILGSYTATKVKLQGSAKTQRGDQSNIIERD